MTGKQKNYIINGTMKSCHISAYVEDDLMIKQIRDSMWASVNAEYHYTLRRPHITVIPPFNPVEGKEDEIRDIVDDVTLVGKSVDLQYVSVYENIHKPFVVLIYVDVELEEEREVLLDKLDQYAQSDIPKPVNPHITLFKTNAGIDDIGDELKEQLQKEIANRQTLGDTTIDRVKTVFKS